MGRPDGWRTVRVADLAAPSANALATGPFGSAISSKFFRSSGVPVIRGSNLSTDSEIRLRDQGLAFLEPEKAAEFSRSVVRRGDLVFTSWGTINQIGIIDDSAQYAEYVISNKQMKLTPDPKIASAEFLYYLFSGPQMQQDILEGAIGSSVPGFNLARLRSIELNLPPLNEQIRIAEAIGDADHLARHLARIIAKKQDVKQGMMQELLTGRIRLEGFSDTWTENVALSDISTKFSGYWGGNPGSGDVDGLVIRAGDIGADHGMHGYAVRGLSTAQATRARCSPGDVVLTASGTIGNVALITEGRYFASNFVRVLRPRRGVLGAYLYYALQTANARAAMDANLGLSAMPNLGAGFYRETWLQAPPEAEQAALVDVMQDADAELAGLQRRLESARAIKQGMMQELLTGGTRLVAEGVAA